ncbi:helix-turn-helix domain-containing protein [Amycolatopsis sp. SID8362]|uniref:MarR family winged helix-turn-helix transcriptional regulator n=2 Tax=Amycolatopsis sp. SID8362 TaxID=2690346 RepID=UPI0013700C21|nr:helix-turn-helix domain-containing protein [Amycolatopsis sp. SID8362]NBH05436.1 MarR family transcriptional regulator [Amycolatopsis sp. SID8362]NED42136.1 MarR family transcriptional regulator [Amycolatopsis sp. SID8362]
MAMTSGPDGLGTRMRHVLEILEGDVARFLADIGLDDYRPRYSPVVRALLARGPLAIRDLAAEMRVTHSAASQTVAQMNRAGLVALEAGADARQRIVSLTAKARDLLPLIEAEWAATTEAAEALEAELPYSLRALLDAIVEALDRKPFRERIGETEAARELR